MTFSVKKQLINAAITAAFYSVNRAHKPHKNIPLPKYFG
jgi:hypothetical protein